jgi:rod shape-determining protein MreC
VLIVDASSAVGGRVATTEEIGIVAGTGRQDSLEFQLLDPMADVRVGDALVTFGSKGGRPYAPGVPIGEVVDVSGAAGQLTRVATVRPFADVSQLSIVGVVTKPPREDPRDSVLPRSDSLPTAAPSPAPLGGADSEASAPEEETAATRKEAKASAEATPAPETETPASLQPEADAGGDG